ncbi:hypothetical protein DICPUDRAFT_85014 [Dictyostelium purpureum]|uniref:Uncharacterized protein n=1 Tax=Dictyostelium purpureum TaxID=5786 RepID=F1A4E9_DICPU|nr:uncharacterized protein DICPUDRAFT_85014 [Dictyostelium purpureum]EGC28930.1 hypothetical protein DICPUDRAFT_85014 [Dictyostelium purpureum]|eukprot:XP_003294544.1 hypothetical protein DICPUDRAFT_85014 [Dictyostelium purpureum]
MVITFRLIDYCYKVNILTLAFSLKNSYSNNNTTTAAPEPTTFSLKNSNRNYNLNNISEYSNLNNNSISLVQSASCSSISSCNSNDINGSGCSGGCNNKNSNSFLINNGLKEHQLKKRKNK